MVKINKEEAQKLIEGIYIPLKTYPIKWINKEERELDSRGILNDLELDKWITDGKPYELVPTFIHYPANSESIYLCAFDVAYGYLLVFDLKKKICHTSKNILIAKDFVFAADFSGFPKGAFFQRVN